MSFKELIWCLIMRTKILVIDLFKPFVAPFYNYVQGIGDDIREIKKRQWAEKELDRMDNDPHYFLE